MNKQEKKEEKEKQIILKGKNRKEKKYKEYITKTQLNKMMKNSQSFMITDYVDENGLIHLKNKEVARVFSVEAIDLSLSSDSQLMTFFSQLKYLYQVSNLDLRIYKLDEKINLNDNKDYILELMNKFKDDLEKQKFLQERYELIEKLENDEYVVSNSYYFLLSAGSESELKKNIDEVMRVSYGINPRINIDEISNRYEVYHFLMNVYCGKTDLEKIMWCNLTDLIVPLNISEKSNLIKIDDEEIELLSIKSVPLFLEGSFFEQIFNLPNTRCCIHIKDTLNTDELVKVIDSSYQFLLSDRATTKKLSDATELDTLKESYQILMDQIKNGDEKIKKVNFIIVVKGDKKKREEVRTELKRLASNYKIKIDVTRLRQYETWQAYDISSNFLEDYAMYFPTLTLSAGFPLTTTKFNDKKGIMMGIDTHTALPVFFDMFCLDSNRTSHNLSIVASTGGGKSFTLKKIITNAVNQGIKVFVFDAEAEYKKLVENNHGEYIDLYSKSGGIINPLQVRFLPVENEDNESDIANCPLAKHMGFLETFYKCAFEEISEKELVVLLEETEKLYANFGITKNSTISMIENMKPNEFPIFDDLKKFIKEEKAKEQIKEKAKIIEQIDILLERFLVGTDSFLFNDYTNLDLGSSNLIGFNLQELLFSDNRRLINTQVLNILTYLNNAIVKNKIENESIKSQNDKKHIMVVVDEFHLFIDEDNMEILKNFGQMARRLRKYSSSFVCATQSVRDFIGSANILRHATAIFNNCQYQLTGMLKEDDLSAYLELFKQNPLTDTQKEFLLKAKQGMFLLNITNKKRVRLWVRATELERQLMGENNE